MCLGAGLRAGRLAECHDMAHWDLDYSSRRKKEWRKFRKRDRENGDRANKKKSWMWTTMKERQKEIERESQREHATWREKEKRKEQSKRKWRGGKLEKRCYLLISIEWFVLASSAWGSPLNTNLSWNSSLLGGKEFSKIICRIVVTVSLMTRFFISYTHLVAFTPVIL